MYMDAPEGLLPMIEIFLEEYGFPRNLKGFYFLAKASELCLREPGRLWGGMGGICEEVARNFTTGPSLAERAIRNLSGHLIQGSAMYRLTEGRFDQRPTNTELICAVCDMFSRTNKTPAGSGYE